MVGWLATDGQRKGTLTISNILILMNTSDTRSELSLWAGGVGGIPPFENSPPTPNLVVRGEIFNRLTLRGRIFKCPPSFLLGVTSFFI